MDTQSVVYILLFYCSISDERIGNVCNLLSRVSHFLQIHVSCTATHHLDSHTELFQLTADIQTSFDEFSPQIFEILNETATTIKPAYPLLYTFMPMKNTRKLDAAGIKYITDHLSV